MDNDDTEESLKKLEEAIHEIHNAEARERWLGYLALISGLLAAFAAVVGLFETQATSKTILAKNDAILAQSRASDQWNFYQAKGIKGHLYEVNATLFPAHADEFKKSAGKFMADKEAIKSKAEELERKVEEKNAESEKYYEKHHSFSFAESFLHISIALASISALTRRKQVLYASLVFGLCGAGFFLYGVIR